MWFTKKSRKDAEFDKKEAQIQAIHRDTLKKIEVNTVPTRRLNDLIEKNKGGVTGLIFLATGGDRRK